MTSPVSPPGRRCASPGSEWERSRRSRCTPTAATPGRVHGGQDERPDPGHGRHREVPQPRGERYLALTQGVGDSAALEDGATIGLERTQSALDLTVLFNGFKPLFAALSPKDVNEFSAEIIAVLQGEGGNINSLLAKTASLTSTLADRDAVIGRTIGNLNAVLATVDEHDAALKSLIDQARRFVSGLAADRATIGASANINSVTAETADLLKVTRPGDPGRHRQPAPPLGRPEQAEEHRSLREVPLDVAGEDHPDHPHGEVRLVVQLLPVPASTAPSSAHRASQARRMPCPRECS